MPGIQSMAELRRKHAPGNEIVSCEAISMPGARRGFGLDWAPPEIEVLMRRDLAPGAMVALLPGRTARAVYLKRHRLGLTAHYRPRHDAANPSAKKGNG